MTRQEDRELALKMLGIKKAAQEEEAKDTKGAERPGEYRGKKDAQQASEGAHEKEAAEKPGKPVLSREEVLSKRAKARAEKKEVEAMLREEGVMVVEGAVVDAQGMDLFHSPPPPLLQRYLQGWELRQLLHKPGLETRAPTIL